MLMISECEGRPEKVFTEFILRIFVAGRSVQLHKGIIVNDMQLKLLHCLYF